MIRFKFDKKKGITSLLYVVRELIAHRCDPGFHKIFKIFYFADMKHIARYGRPIVGDHYVAMKNGPVPSHLYDILKAAKGQEECGPTAEYQQYFKVCGYHVSPATEPEMDELSASEVECLDESIRENMHKSFEQLTDESHDKAYDAADLNNRMSFRDIAKVAGASSAMIAYMAEIAENEGILKDGAHTRGALST